MALTELEWMIEQTLALHQRKMTGFCFCGAEAYTGPQYRAHLASVIASLYAEDARR